MIFKTLSNIEKKIYPQKLEDIIFIKADKNYSIFIFKDNIEKKVCFNLRKFELVMPDKSFFRVHSSYIINKRFILKVHVELGFLKMTSNQTIPIGNTYLEYLTKTLIIL